MSFTTRPRSGWLLIIGSYGEGVRCLVVVQWDARYIQQHALGRLNLAHSTISVVTDTSSGPRTIGVPRVRVRPGITTGVQHARATRDFARDERGGEKE